MTAVSGAHITIFIAVLCELFGKRRRRLTSIVSFAAVLLMMAMFGFSASVVRAGIMLMITQSAPLFCRRTDVLNSLCAALLLMTVLTPFAAADPALLMSDLRSTVSADSAGNASRLLQSSRKPPQYRSVRWCACSRSAPRRSEASPSRRYPLPLRSRRSFQRVCRLA